MLQQKPPALQRGHPAFSKHDISSFSFTYLGYFDLPGSGSGSTGPFETCTNQFQLRPKHWGGESFSSFFLSFLYIFTLTQIANKGVVGTVRDKILGLGKNYENVSYITALSMLSVFCDKLSPLANQIARCYRQYPFELRYLLCRTYLPIPVQV